MDGWFFKVEGMNMEKLSFEAADRSTAPDSLRRVFCRYLRKHDGLGHWLGWLLSLADAWENLRGVRNNRCPDPLSAGLRSRVIDRVPPRILRVTYRRMIREELIQHLRNRGTVQTDSRRTENRSNRRCNAGMETTV